jgi:hypothetical protein
MEDEHEKQMSSKHPGFPTENQINNMAGNTVLNIHENFQLSLHSLEKIAVKICGSIFDFDKYDVQLSS